ncbi:hypothetical protein D3C87_1001750 [compost metagenome]
MSYIHRCMIVPAAQQALAREMVLLLAGEPAREMFTTGLSADGDLPYTHYISSGMIEEQFGAVLADPALMTLLAVDAGRALTTVLECTTLLAACDITEEEPFAALERMALVMLNAEELAALQAEKAAKGPVILNG